MNGFLIAVAFGESGDSRTRGSKMPTGEQRWHVHFSGQVQGVGFRYRTANIAKLMDVRGFVRNLPNGQVELIGEGNTGSLEALIREIQAAMADGIQNVDIKKSPSPAEFSSFEVRF